jgi:hypothetical protein
VTWGPFSRGFQNAVTFKNAAAFTRHADAIFAAGPVNTVTIEDARPDAIRALAASPHTSRLRTLILRAAQFDDAAMRNLVGLPRLAELTTLDLRGTVLGEEGAAAMAGVTCRGCRRSTWKAAGWATQASAGSRSRRLSCPSPTSTVLQRRDRRWRIALASPRLASELSELWLLENAIGDAGVGRWSGRPLPRR